jgi:hypothetical protein
MNAQTRPNKPQQPKGMQSKSVGVGIVAVVGSLAMGSTVMLAALTAGAQSSGLASSTTSPDGGAPSYIVAAGRGLVTPPDVEDVEHMCALLTSCDKLPFPPQMIPSNMASCINTMSQDLSSPNAVKFSLTIRECGLRANSCSELRNCALRGAKINACDGRGKSGAVGICDLDGRAISCWHEQVLGVRDCPRGGEQCVVREGQATCALGPCSGENKEGTPATCSASGTRILQCEHGKLQSLDCAAFGLRCVSENGTAGCAPSTPACATTAKRCEGNVSVGCVHGHEVRVDCGAAGLSCSAVPGSTNVGACVATPPAQPADKCDPKDTPKCDGATIKYCYAGKKRSYFCKSLAFDKCVVDGKGARCTN